MFIRQTDNYRKNPQNRRLYLIQFLVMILVILLIRTNNTSYAFSIGQTDQPTQSNGLGYALFDNTRLAGTPLVTGVDATVDWQWGTAAPSTDLPRDSFSVRWSGQVEAAQDGTYTFITRSDDGVRLWVDGQRLIDNWTNHAVTENRGSITLATGQRYDLQLEYYEQSGQATIQLFWEAPGQARQIIPSEQLYPDNPSSGEPACTITVAKSGGDHTSLQVAADSTQPGDVVCVREGTYREYVEFSQSGTDEQPITFMAVPDAQVIFDGSDRTPGENQPRVFTVSGSYLVFRGFEITNSASDGILNYEGNHNIFDDLIIHHNYSNGLNLYSGNDNLITNSVAHHNNGTGGYNSDGFKTYQGDRNVFRHNIAYANSDDGFDTWIGRNNILEFNLAYENGYGPNGDGDGVGFKLGGEMPERRGGLNTAHFNVAFQNRTSGFDMNAAEHNDIYHNTACGHNLDFRSFGPGGNEFKNNISCENRISLLDNDVSDHNTWDLGIADAQFRNTTDLASTNFLRLKSTSPVIDAGVDVRLPFAGSAPDLGAFEVGLSWPR
ncbi:MAG: hypothetical protein GFH27_549279n128 [Chloroflexi bacterium AL-W]|nr:hypothetical protein [Chloroflexi bacterium AL-N1]NOK65094.1 hypothetical protein [Chloroflexi bacterium AL-N10]NOK72639.1 hypothetical protein [Chloroflexi bacterium AL-N5]NOK79273.1 hypothetical protein [Chloroflexi bacterium AL-W]NOK87189.1 hypothetical protein [Chloroflexi bacterium AL-N15]